VSAPDAAAKVPGVEAVMVKSCPAPIARVKLAEGTVEAIGCPEDAKDDVKRFPAKSRLVLLDASGKTKSEIVLTDAALRRLRAFEKVGAPEDIELVSAIKRTWWLHAAREGRKGQDIYEIRTSAEGKDVGNRYSFENARWIVRSGPLKNWTGEHLKDTEAEFP
jgi:hypothetical protein